MEQNNRRGSHSMVVLNEKLYCAGEYNGERMVSSMEMYEPRTDSWVVSEPMKFDRGYPTAVLGSALYVIGGITHEQQIMETVYAIKKELVRAEVAGKALGKEASSLPLCCK